MKEVWRLASSHPDIRDSNMKSIGSEENKNDGFTDNEFDDEEDEDQTENIVSADDVQMKNDGTLNLLEGEGGKGMGPEKVTQDD